MSFKSFGDEIEFLYQFGVIPALKGLVCNLSAIGDVRYRFAPWLVASPQYPSEYLIGKLFVGARVSFP